MKSKVSIFIHMILVFTFIFTFIFTLVMALLSAGIVASIPSENKKGPPSAASDLNRVESFFSSIAFSYEDGVVELDYDSGSHQPALTHVRVNLNPNNFLAQRSFWVNFIVLLFFLSALFVVFVELMILSMLVFGFIETIWETSLTKMERIFLKKQIFSRPIGYQSKHAPQKNVFINS